MLENRRPLRKICKHCRIFYKHCRKFYKHCEFLHTEGLFFEQSVSKV